MHNIIRIVIFAFSSLLPGILFAKDKLEQGKDHIDVHAISEGLRLHNLFQSNMVLQRDKRSIRLWGWADLIMMSLRSERFRWTKEPEKMFASSALVASRV